MSAPSHKRTLALPQEVEHWFLTTLRETLAKIGAKVVRQGRYITFQLAEVAIPRRLFAEILRLIDGLPPIFLSNPMFNGGLTETRKMAKLARIYSKPISDADGAACFQRAPRGQVPERNPCRAPLQIAIHGGEPVHRRTEAR